ncbi:copper resistance CopC family protein [Aeromicrobium fastidiosum]|uniref:copper resistance CopC family protein n=1 Tax=Aeromicrobium fastidiosum TaxID=52699 RepID=UPI00165F6A46|nr:copper resistance CopC family protein [Aeromicrobium fastidiosum]MBP2391887.1 methionine-rich copper-binding protein CopC [Aeromicrobium fastidiosum]
MRNNLLLRGIVLVTAALVLGAGPASAHAALVGTDPEDGSTLAAAPSSITFTFNENVSRRAQVAVAAPDGSQVKVTGVRGLDNTVSAKLADVGQRGTYSASYRVVSADGHPVTGTIAYDVSAGRTVTQVAGPKQEDFIHRHSSHLFWGILAAVVAIVLLLAPLRRRNDPDAA